MFAAWDVWPVLAVRGLVSHLDLGVDMEKAGIAYSLDVRLQSAGLVLDWHAFRNGFRLSGGAFYNRNELFLTARRGVAEGIEIGGRLYDGVLDAVVDFGGLAPYLGLGWSSGRGRRGLSFGVEAGVFFQGTPGLSASGTVSEDGVPCEFSLSEDGVADVACPSFGRLEVDLEAEHRELRSEVEQYQFYPVVSFSLSYRF